MLQIYFWYETNSIKFGALDNCCIQLSNDKFGNIRWNTGVTMMSQVALRYSVITEAACIIDITLPSVRI